MASLTHDKSEPSAVSSYESSERGIRDECVKKLDLSRTLPGGQKSVSDIDHKKQ